MAERRLAAPCLRVGRTLTAAVALQSKMRKRFAEKRMLMERKDMHSLEREPEAFTQRKSLLKRRISLADVILKRHMTTIGPKPIEELMEIGYPKKFMNGPMPLTMIWMSTNLRRL